MRRLAFSAALVLLSVAPAHAQRLPAEAQAYLGEWTTYGDDGREAQAVILLSEEGGVVRGRIVRLLPTERHPEPEFRCDDCHGHYEGDDLRTVPLIEGMEWQGDELAGGRITDPTTGKSYGAVMRLDGPDELRVRGFVGIRALGRTQVWRRTH